MIDPFNQSTMLHRVTRVRGVVVSDAMRRTIAPWYVMARDGRDWS